MHPKTTLSAGGERDNARIHERRAGTISIPIGSYRFALLGGSGRVGDLSDLNRGACIGRVSLLDRGKQPDLRPAFRQHVVAWNGRRRIPTDYAGGVR
jgi:hypothetical protein